MPPTAPHPHRRFAPAPLRSLRPIDDDIAVIDAAVLSLDAAVPGDAADLLCTVTLVDRSDGDRDLAPPSTTSCSFMKARALYPNLPATQDGDTMVNPHARIHAELAPLLRLHDSVELRIQIEQPGSGRIGRAWFNHGPGLLGDFFDEEGRPLVDEHGHAIAHDHPEGSGAWEEVPSEELDDPLDDEEGV